MFSCIFCPFFLLYILLKHGLGNILEVKRTFQIVMSRIVLSLQILLLPCLFIDQHDRQGKSHFKIYVHQVSFEGSQEGQKLEEFHGRNSFFRGDQGGVKGGANRGPDHPKLLSNKNKHVFNKCTIRDCISCS